MGREREGRSSWEGTPGGAVSCTSLCCGTTPRPRPAGARDARQTGAVREPPAMSHVMEGNMPHVTHHVIRPAQAHSLASCGASSPRPAPPGRGVCGSKARDCPCALTQPTPGRQAPGRTSTRRYGSPLASCLLPLAFRLPPPACCASAPAQPPQPLLHSSTAEQHPAVSFSVQPSTTTHPYPRRLQQRPHHCKRLL